MPQTTRLAPSNGAYWDDSIQPSSDNLNEPNYGAFVQADYGNLNESYYGGLDHVQHFQQPTSHGFNQNLTNTPNANMQMQSMMPPPASLRQRANQVSVTQNPHLKRKSTSASETHADMAHQSHPNILGSPFAGQRLTRTPSNQSSNFASGSPYFGNQDDQLQISGRSPQPGNTVLGRPCQYDEFLPNIPVGHPNSMTRRPSERNWTSGSVSSSLLESDGGQPPQVRTPSNQGHEHFNGGEATNVQASNGVNGKRTRTSVRARHPQQDFLNERQMARREVEKANQRQGELEAQRAFQNTASQRATFYNRPQRNALPAHSDRGMNGSQRSFHREIEMGTNRDLLPMGRNPAQQSSGASTSGRATPTPFGILPGTAQDPHSNQNSPYQGQAQMPLPDPRLGGIAGYGQGLLGYNPYNQIHGMAAGPTLQSQAGLARSPSYQHPALSHEGRALAQSPYQFKVPGAPHVASAPLYYPPAQQARNVDTSRQPSFGPRSNMELQPTSRSLTPQPPQSLALVPRQGKAVSRTSTPSQARLANNRQGQLPSRIPTPQPFQATGRQGQLVSRNPTPQPPQAPRVASRQGQLVPQDPRPQPNLTTAQRDEYRRVHQQFIELCRRIPAQWIFASQTLPRNPVLRLHHLLQISPLLMYRPNSLTDIGPPIIGATAESWAYFLNEDGLGEDFLDIARACETIPIQNSPVLAWGIHGGLEVQAGQWNDPGIYQWPLQGDATDQAFDQWINFPTLEGPTNEALGPKSGGGHVLGEVDLDGMQFGGEGGAGPCNSGPNTRRQNTDEAFPPLPSSTDTFEGGPAAYDPDTMNTSGVDPFSFDPFADAAGQSTGPSTRGSNTGGVSNGKRKRDGNDGDESQTEV